MGRSLEASMKKFEYFKPKTLEEALTLFAKYGEKAKWIAGGTDVIVMIKQKTMAPDVIPLLDGFSLIKSC